MTMFARLVLILSLAVPPGLAMGADPQDISWHMLAPPAAVIENPFENLTDDQMDTCLLYTSDAADDDRIVGL